MSPSPACKLCQERSPVSLIHSYVSSAQSSACHISEGKKEGREERRMEAGSEGIWNNYLSQGRNDYT